MSLLRTAKTLDARIHDKEIEQEIYARLIEILEIEYFQQQEEERAKIEGKFRNALLS